jgi:hypothetical protein
MVSVGEGLRRGTACDCLDSDVSQGTWHVNVGGGGD